ncbi:Protein ALP1-like [Holothuria leucospilota]|uniref:Protein ALP1-like n=1 Tax=Holothuria leucospilota TaxID=206669 RepID=A0A9Q1BZZ0_HOLLE|nr:Protein ALP1-like [Holothuria leucospilota]
MVRPIIQKKDTIMREAISANERLSITLRFLATGNSFEDLKFITRTSPQAIGKIVFETCEVITQCLQRQQAIKIPRTPEEWREISNAFATTWNFPHCVGAIDGKHVAIRKPPESGSFYFNYKKFFSIVLMAVVGADYEFIMVDAGVNGRVSDGGVIAVTEFGRLLDDGSLGLPEPAPLHQNDVIAMPYVFVGDDAFAMSENLLKPYGGDRLESDQRIYNYRLSRARRVTENAFGILTARFGVFQKAMQLSPEKATLITMTCCYLHNFLRKKSRCYIGPGAVDWEDANHEMHAGEWRASQRQLEGLRATMNRNAGNTARLVRDAFRHYFCTQGQVPWQDSM